MRQHLFRRVQPSPASARRRLQRPGLGWLAMAVIFGGCAARPPAPAPAPASAATAARVVHHEAFPSSHVATRRITVWLPPGYDEGSRRYAVLYMHDGQNLIDPATSMGNEAWEVDRHLESLAREGRIQATILVGIDNSPTRWQDYAPEEPLATLSARLKALATGREPGPPHSDGYLRFLVEELKPFIDAHYRTLPDRSHTHLMGSSMGGLISIYALARYPEVFGGAACLSTHWPYTTNPDVLRAAGSADSQAIADATIGWLGNHVPDPGAHRVYFDHGTEFLDALYAPYQERVDALFARRGYSADAQFRSLVFAGATHNERSWRERLDVPLTFLLGP